MTTERSGMSLDSMSSQLRDFPEVTFTNIDGTTFTCIDVADAIDAHLSRDAVVPDAKPLPDLMLASYHEAVGWNACRKAMLAQRDGGLR